MEKSAFKFQLQVKSAAKMANTLEVLAYFELLFVCLFFALEEKIILFTIT